MKKVLFVANTDMHINLCYLPYMKYLKNENYSVDVATNTFVSIDYCDKKISIPIYRNPFHFGNIIAIFKLRKIINKEKYDLVSCSTPMGGVIARLASSKAKKKYKTKVLYTVHGFHFFKGCNFFKGFLYYLVEKFLSRYNDMLITINEEDYKFALKYFNVDVRYIKGIGFNNHKFDSNLSKKEKIILKQKLGIAKNDYVIIYVAEISKRKRQKYLLDVLSIADTKKIKLLLVGNNLLEKKIYKYIKKKKLDDVVKILGFRNDISNLLDISDLVVSVSMQEGLPLNIMEAMYKQKPIIVTDCRGNRDLISNGVNGLVVPINNKYELIKAIDYLKNNKDYSKKIGENNKNNVSDYTIDQILKEYVKIYNELLD